MSDFGHALEDVLREFMGLGHGVPGHDAFPRLFRMLGPASPGTALLRLAQDWADALDDVVAVDGKALRRSFGDAACTRTTGPCAASSSMPRGNRTSCSR